MEQIMNQTDVKVSFYLKKSEADAKGNCPVMARLIVGKCSETAFSVKLRVPQSLWLSGRACGKSAAARDINNRLDEIRAAAFSIYVRPYKLLSKYPTGKGLGKCSLKNLSSPDLSERETGRGV